MNPATAAATSRSTRWLANAFALFNTLRIVAYLPTLMAIQSSGGSEQHSLFTWFTFLGANATMALWLHEQNGRRVDRAILVNACNAVMCAMIVGTILWLRVVAALPVLREGLLRF